MASTVNEQWTQLAKEQASLRVKVEFLQRWTMPRYLQPRRPSSSRRSSAAIDTGQGAFSLEHLSNCVQSLREQLDALVALQDRLASVALIKPLTTTSATLATGEDEILFIRAWNPDDHCRLTGLLGLVCWNMTDCQPAMGFSDLQDRAILSEDSLRNHYNELDPTPFISFSDDPAWLLEHIKYDWPVQGRSTDGGEVIFVSAEALAKLCIPFEQSDQLENRVGARRGYPYGTNGSSHWMVYGWVPPQAIRVVMPMRDFSAWCEHAIRTCGRSSGPIRPRDILDLFEGK